MMDSEISRFRKENLLYVLLVTINTVTQMKKADLHVIKYVNPSRKRRNRRNCVCPQNMDVKWMQIFSHSKLDSYLGAQVKIDRCVQDRHMWFHWHVSAYVETVCSLCCKMFVTFIISPGLVRKRLQPRLESHSLPLQTTLNHCSYAFLHLSSGAHNLYVSLSTKLGQLINDIADTTLASVLTHI